MKKLLALFFILASFSSFAQISKMGGMASRVNDSITYVTSSVVTTAHTDGYSDIWFSNTSNLWWVWDASAYVNWDPSASGGGGSFWPLGGNATLTNHVIITDPTGTYAISIGDAIDRVVGFEVFATSSIHLNSGTTRIVGSGTMTFDSDAGKVQIIGGDSINLISPAIKIPTIPISDTTAYLVAWSAVDSSLVRRNVSTISGGGGGAVGSAGNVQFASAVSGNNQAEAAFSYDSATNLLTVPSLTAGSSSSLTDGAAITITGSKHTLTSDEATITWTLSQTSDQQVTRVTLNAVTSTWTFPANTFCIVEGIATQSNVAILDGVSGDLYIMSIYKDGTDYEVVIKNRGQ